MLLGIGSQIFDTLLPQLEAQGVLTVGDALPSAKKGVAINFVLRGEKLNFEINQRAVDRAGLVVSAQLLKLAILVDESVEESKEP